MSVKYYKRDGKGNRVQISYDELRRDQIKREEESRRLLDQHRKSQQNVAPPVQR